jgi:hypothetical protein
MTEAVDYAARTIPDGIYDRWLRSGYGEFLLMSGRWAEAERVLYDLDPSAAEAYLRSEVLSLRAHLLAHRGQAEEAMAIAPAAAETSARIGDVQAVLPSSAALAAAQAGIGDHRAVVATIDRAVERRGELRESIISSWFLFEATDTLTAIAAVDPASADLRAGIASLATFARVLAPEAARGGDLVQAEVRRALFGAAAEQLSRLARMVGVDFTASGDAFPGSEQALAILDREHRVFDAARVRLWLAEAGEVVATAAVPAATFAELGARAYLERAQPNVSGRGG